MDIANYPQTVLSESEPPWTDEDDDGLESEPNEANARTCASEILTQLDGLATQPFPNPDSEEPDKVLRSSCIESVAFTQQLIAEIKRATLDNDRLDADVLTMLRNPVEEPPDISNPDTR